MHTNARVRGMPGCGGLCEKRGCGERGRGCGGRGSGTRCSGTDALQERGRESSAMLVECAGCGMRDAMCERTAGPVRSKTGCARGVPTPWGSEMRFKAGGAERGTCGGGTLAWCAARTEVRNVARGRLRLRSWRLGQGQRAEWDAGALSDVAGYEARSAAWRGVCVNGGGVCVWGAGGVRSTRAVSTIEGVGQRRSGAAERDGGFRMEQTRRVRLAVSRRRRGSEGGAQRTGDAWAGSVWRHAAVKGGYRCDVNGEDGRVWRRVRSLVGVCAVLVHAQDICTRASAESGQLHSTHPVSDVLNPACKTRTELAVGVIIPARSTATQSENVPHFCGPRLRPPIDSNPVRSEFTGAGNLDWMLVVERRKRRRWGGDTGKRS
ncbi:hypothetical protein DFH09DRAFT_1404507 [Mycena vulgaris]|nr:hypothetical protein DFH09DRAFT_1404507 [Mycena vulgaris]